MTITDLHQTYSSASSGRRADWLAEEQDRRNLENLILLPFQDFDDLPYMLASADVLTVVLEQEAGSYSIPSKILSYLCNNSERLFYSSSACVYAAGKQTDPNATALAKADAYPAVEAQYRAQLDA